MTVRTCGGCTLCCDLIPVKEIGNLPFHGCQFKRSVLHAAGPGCGIYQRRPYSCRAWRCMWLKSSPENVPDEMRPDRAGFVIDENLDLIRVQGAEMVVAQVWVAPGHENDWHDDGPAAGAIRGLLDDHEGVLWRMPPGDNARLFVKDPEGEPVPSQVVMTPDEHETRLGTAADRQRRIDEIYRQRRRKR